MYMPIFNTMSLTNKQGFFLQYKHPLHFILALALFCSLGFFCDIGTANAYRQSAIQPVDLQFSAKDVAGLDFGFHESSFESWGEEYSLELKNGVFTDGKKKVTVASLAILLDGLDGLYPGTHALSWEAWSDDYPSSWINLHLKDGRILRISSSSQLDGMFPWNISIWESEQAKSPDQVYVQLNPDFWKSLDSLWHAVRKEGFPRQKRGDSFWEKGSFPFYDSVPKVLHFYISGNDSDAETATIWGAKPSLPAPFIAEFRRNDELKTLLDAGYTVYDLVLTLEVKPKTLEPVQYHGTLAMASPDGQDAVVGVVTIPFDPAQSVTTSLQAKQSFELVKHRRTNPISNQAGQILSPLTFLLDTRTEKEKPDWLCPEGKDFSLDGKPMQAIWNAKDSQYVSFYPLKKNRWGVKFSLRRKDPNWDDNVAHLLLKTWFPKPFADLPVQDLQDISSFWRISFLPGVTLQNPGLLPGLKSAMPEKADVHEQNPEKEGDYGFVSFEEHALVLTDGSAPEIVYCGPTFPDWYGSAYDVNKVISPDEYAERNSLPDNPEKKSEWFSLIGTLPNGNINRVNWTNIAFTQPGFLHALWSVENKGVYYADGWANGAGWLPPQRLGDDAYWLTMRAWPDGEIHLWWDAGLVSRGSVHIWRPAGGEWQKAEHWPIAYFDDIMRGPDGTIHVGSYESDGLDSEYMYRTWSQQNGLSGPVNISRMQGNMGNRTSALRMDFQGHMHAVWSHVLQEKSAPDPLTGETSDISGVFYSHELSDGHWSKPERIGSLGAYAHALSMELDQNGNPLIIWQSDSGLVSRLNLAEQWLDVVKLADVAPPETPAEFGPGRQVQPSATLKTAVDSHGRVFVAWLIPQVGLKVTSWDGAAWMNAVDIVPDKEKAKLQTDPLTLEMSMDAQDQLHFVFFKGNTLQYALYRANQEIETVSLGITYDLYGLPEARLMLDGIGSVAVLGLPRSPYFKAKLPDTGLPPTFTPHPRPTATYTPTAKPSITPFPTSTVTPSATPMLVLSSTLDRNAQMMLFLFFGMIGLLLIWLFVRARAKKSI